MRTTLTIDDDLALRLRELAHERKTSFKETVNDVLRRGLVAQDAPLKAQPYTIIPFASPFRSGVDSQKLNQLSDELETEHAIDSFRREVGEG